jgi:hypothetical protein
MKWERRQCTRVLTVRHGMGVQFTELSHEGRQFISDLVEKQSQVQNRLNHWPKAKQYK